MDPVQFLEKFREHAVELVYYLLTLIYGHLWESASRIVKDGPLRFTVFLHEEGAFAHHLEVCPFPSDFIPSSFLGTFLKADEELENFRKVVGV